MKVRLSLFFALCWSLFTFAADRYKPGTDQELATLFANLDLQAAGKQAEQVLLRDPKNPVALFVRMEVAELKAQTSVALDSALRLCQTHASPSVLEIASARVLRYAGNTQAFHAVLRRVKAAAEQENDCSTNLQLALVATAADGDSSLSLSAVAASAGLLTRWQMAGPFGHYSNADFDHQWQPESDRLSHVYYGKVQIEEFFFPDGFVSLPDYFSAPGIFYAASDLELKQPENSVLEVLGPGPYAVSLDGRLVTTRDSRYAAAPSRSAVALKLEAGKHRFVVKFTTDAAPFRVLVRPHSKASSLKASFDAPSLNGYIQGLTAYFSDDLLALQRAVRSDSGRATEYLRALLYSAIEGHTSQARTVWQSLAPAALAQIRVAAIDSSPSIIDLADALPDSEVAQQVAFEILRRQDSLERLLALHPSCSHLSEALKFFAAHGEQDQAHKVEEQLANCAPESLLYAKVLGGAGRHAQAADYLLKLLEYNPLNRAVRRMLIEELLLDGRAEEALQQAAKLHAIALNSPSFARLAIAPYEVLDSTSGRAAGFARRNQFFLPYRRDGLKIIQQSAPRHFSGGPSVVLLDDKVVQLCPGGSISIYTHRITRLLNKDGISRLGEVSIPRGADLLELRTVKPNGQIIEPELAIEKPTISMPALEPGDSIEEEVVRHYADWDEAPDDAAEFTFGSFSAPILYSRFVLMAPENLPLEIAQKKAVTRPQVEHLHGSVIETWEGNDIAQTHPENDLPPEKQLPFVMVRPAEDLSARRRDELIAATRIGVQVEEVAQTFRESKHSDFEKARRLYRFVTAKIQSSGADWSANSAEETLLNSQGSRTAVLLALARSLGLKAELVLAHRTGLDCQPATNCYTQPLVRFVFADDNILDTDAESTDLPFGAVPTALDRDDALLVPTARQNGQSHVALRPGSADEQSTAKADLILDESGSLTVELRVRLGIARGQQIRELLRRSNERERRFFFDQLATRIFPGASSVSGSSAHEDDPEQPLELTLRCHVLQMMNPSGPWELEQLVPALGLRDLYVKSSTRNFPLYIDSLLSESTTFHVHLPGKFEVSLLPSEFKERTPFGDYSAQFTADSQQITIHREFRIPVQTVSPQNYEAFASFARRVDEAERGKILLAVRATSAALTKAPQKQ